MLHLQGDLIILQIPFLPGMLNSPFYCFNVSGYIILCGIFIGYCVSVLYLTDSKQQLLQGGEERLAAQVFILLSSPCHPAKKKKKKNLR